MTLDSGRFVIDARYVRTRPSGIGIYVAALIARMPALAPEARFQLWTHPECPVPVISPNVRCSVVPAVADGLRTLLSPSSLNPLQPSDVLHLPFSLLGRALPCPAVVTIHDLMWLEQPELVDARPGLNRLRGAFYQIGMRVALARASRLIAVSHATADRMIAVHPGCRERIRVIHNGVGEAFRAASDREAARARAAALIGSDAPYYLVLGKNEPYKGHRYALEAFAREARKGELLVLVQRTRPGAGLARVAQTLGIAEQVRWLPTLSEAELVSVLQGARALVQPSIVEGFGIPVLEAMAAGCPVIASDTPALVEVLGGAGLHAAVRDVAGLARAMSRVRDESLRGELRERGLERARAFSWHTAAEQTLEVYREALSFGRGPRAERGHA